MEKTDLQNLKDGLSTSIKEYSNTSLTDNDKMKYLQIIEKEAKLISDGETSKINAERQQSKDELEKDHTYFQEELEKQKFNYAKEKDMQDRKIESLKLELEKQKLEMEKSDLEYKKTQTNLDAKYRWLTFGITTAIGFIQFGLSLYAYRKLAYTNLNLIYKDEGRPTTDYKDAIQNVKRMIKQ